MSKKKPTTPLPLTGVITITTDGRSTLAMKATHRGEDIEVSTGMANCRPGDVYSEYEGARIALARLYDLDPFPQEDKPQEDKPQEAPIPEAPKPFTPSFQVGDIVRLTEKENFFHPSCRGKVGKVIRASETPVLPGAMYFLAVNLKSGDVRHQYCTEWPNDPAPLELLFRDPQKDGEKA